MEVKFILNNQPVQIEVPEDTSLLTLLRDYLGLTGTKCGCDTGNCGVCAVILDGKLVNSCQIKVQTLFQHQVTTIEGIHGEDGGPNDLQQAFLDHGAVSCGYCTPAMVLAGEALLQRTPTPAHEEIRQALAHVLCRCTGYQQIEDAIQETAQKRLSQVKE